MMDKRRGALASWWVLVLAVMLLGFIIISIYLVQANQKISSELAFDHSSSSELIKLETTIAKAEFIETGDGIEENVTFRNEQCANDEALAQELGKILDDPTLPALVQKQCAIPFKPPTIDVTTSGTIKNKTGLPADKK